MIQVGLMGSIVALGLSDPQSEAGLTALFALLVAFFSASQDIVIDAYRIEILDDDQQGAGAAMTQAGYRFGLLVSGAGALYLATEINWSLVYGIMAVLILVGFITALLAPIPDTDRECEERVHFTGRQCSRAGSGWSIPNKPRAGSGAPEHEQHAPSTRGRHRRTGRKI